MRRPSSLTSGITTAFLSACLLTATLLIVLLIQRNDAAIERLETHALMGRAQTIAQALRHNHDSGWSIELPPNVAAAFSAIYGRAAYAVVDSAGRYLVGSGTASPLAVPTGEQSSYNFTLRREGREWRGLAIPVNLDGNHLSIQVAEDLQHPDVLLDDAASGFLRDVAWIVAPIFVVLGGATFWLIGRFRSPLYKLAGQASRISSASPDERLSEEGVPNEILPLVRAVNGVLGRMEASQAEQRAFIADAAHELRTPLAVLQAHLDLMQDRAAAATLGQDLGTMERMVGQLLTVAALDDVSLKPNTIVDLRVLAADLSGMLEPLAVSRGVTLRQDYPEEPVTFFAEEEALSQAIVNLLENAIGHAPEGSAVTIAVRPGPTLEVSDAGCGVPEHERKLIFRRFWRTRRHLDRKRRGAGLGLAIVRRAAEIHGGTACVCDAPGGGALFRVALKQN